MALDSRYGAIQVPMFNLDSIAAFRQRLANSFSKHHRTVTSPRAAKSYREIAFAFADIVRNEICEEALDAAKEFACLFEGANVSGNARILAAKRAKFRDKMGIRQEADIED